MCLACFAPAPPDYFAAARPTAPPPSLETILATAARLRAILGPPTPVTDRLVEDAVAGRSSTFTLDELATLMAEREAVGVHKGEQAGRLAVYRGDVEHALREPDTGLLVVLPRHERMVATLERELARDLLEVDRRIVERDLKWSRAYVRQFTMQIADCRRWLEATR